MASFTQVDYHSSHSTFLEDPNLKLQLINKSYSFSGDHCHSDEVSWQLVG